MRFMPCLWSQTEVEPYRGVASSTLKCGLQLPGGHAGEPREPEEHLGSCLEAVDVLGMELMWASLTHLKFRGSSMGQTSLGDHKEL